jgi:hypothetical protein
MLPPFVLVRGFWPGQHPSVLIVGCSTSRFATVQRRSDMGDGIARMFGSRVFVNAFSYEEGKR